MTFGFHVLRQPEQIDTYNSVSNISQLLYAREIYDLHAFRKDVLLNIL